METLDAFLAIYADDDNEWWRLDSGQHQNLFDSLLARAESAKAEVERLRGMVTELTMCDCGTHLSRGMCRFCDNDE